MSTPCASFSRHLILGHGAVRSFTPCIERFSGCLDGEVGFEPTHVGTKNRWLTTCLLPKDGGFLTPGRHLVRLEEPPEEDGTHVVRWMGCRESNPNLMDQNQPSYRWTTPQNVKNLGMSACRGFLAPPVMHETVPTESNPAG